MPSANRFLGSSLEHPSTVRRPTRPPPAEEPVGRVEALSDPPRVPPPIDGPIGTTVIVPPPLPPEQQAFMREWRAATDGAPEAIRLDCEIVRPLFCFESGRPPSADPGLVHNVCRTISSCLGGGTRVTARVHSVPGKDGVRGGGSLLAFSFAARSVRELENVFGHEQVRARIIAIAPYMDPGGYECPAPEGYSPMSHLYRLRRQEVFSMNGLYGFDGVFAG